MSTPSESDPPAGTPTPKGLSLHDLLPEKRETSTSIGPFFVRHATVKDWKGLTGDDAVELGENALRTLANRIQDKDDHTPMDVGDFAALTGGDDSRTVANAIAERNGWGELPAGPTAGALGEVIKSARTKRREQNMTIANELRNSVSKSYAFLPETTLEKLQGQVAQLTDLNKSISGTSALTEALRRTGMSADAKGGAASLRALDEAMNPISSLKAAMRSAGLDNSFTHVTARRPSPFSVADQLREEVGAVRGTEKPIALQSARFVPPPRVEDTPTGRATIESARNSREVAEKIDTLATVVGGMNQTLVTEVLPIWMGQVQNTQQNAKEAFEHAARNLRWTTISVVASILAAALLAWWQVDVAQKIDQENTRQQQALQSLLKEQLAAQRTIIDQQAREAAQLRTLLDRMAGGRPPSSGTGARSVDNKQLR